MSDEELVPEIQTEVAQRFLRSTTTEFQAITILPDLSIRGSSDMLAIRICVQGANLKRRDATHIDPIYASIGDRKLAKMFRAKRIVRVSECWASVHKKSDDPKTYIAPHLDPRSRDFLVATIQHIGQTEDFVAIMWEIHTTANGTRTLGVPEVAKKSKIQNPDLVL